jgi:hypothetical protein
MATETTRALHAFSRLVHARPRIVMFYETWSDRLFYPAQLRPIVRGGAVPMITWDPTVNGRGMSLTGISDGQADRYLVRSAREARRWHGPILIRFAHEMNLPGEPYGPGRPGDDPTSFVRAWHHVVDVFRANHATNVSWVWSPNVDCGGHCPFGAFYPGDSWVSWVGLDGYNQGPLTGRPWLSFRQVFARSYHELASITSKPVIITETASTAEGGNKARWIRGIGRDLVKTFRHVTALIWFQRIKETDWRVNSSRASLAAFRALIHSPPFSR